MKDKTKKQALERRIILIAGAILLILGAIYRFMPEIDWGNDQQLAHALKTQKLARLVTQIQSKAQVDTQFRKVQKQVARNEAALLSGNTPALAGGEIQSHLKSASERLGLTLKRVHVLKPIEIEDLPYVLIPVQVTMEASIRELKEFLYQVAASKKMMRIDRLQIRILGSASKPSGLIQAAFTLEGVMKDQP